MNGTLIDCLTVAAGYYPRRIATADREGALTYQELDRLSGRVRDRLRKMNVRRGDRVGIYMRDSVDAGATMLGVLRAGATYVPIPGGAPAAHAALMTHASALKAIVIERELAAEWREEMANYGGTPPALEIGTPGGGLALWIELHLLRISDPAPVTVDEPAMPEELAFSA